MCWRVFTTFHMTRHGSTSGYSKMSVQAGADDAERGNEEGESEEPITFADLGIPTGPQLQDTALGKSRKIADIEKKEIAFLVLSIVSILATVVLTIIKIATVQKGEADFTFALVLLINAAFCMFYVTHGVLLERPYEIFIFVIATVVVVIYIIINFAVKNHDVVKIVRLVLACLLGPAMIGLGGWIGRGYLSAGKLIFRTIGASVNLQTACKMLYLFLSLLKLDLQLGISTVIFIMTSGVHLDTEDIVVLSCGTIVSIGVFILGNIATRYEHKIGTIAFFALCPVQIAYDIYKIVQSGRSIGTAEGLAISTFVCCALSILVRIMVIVVSILVFRNYNKGLKEKVFARTSTEKSWWNISREDK